ELVARDARRLVTQMQLLLAVRRELGAAREQLEDLHPIRRRRTRLGQLFERPGVRFVLFQELAQDRLAERGVADRTRRQCVRLAQEGALFFEAPFEHRAASQRRDEIALTPRGAL